MKTASNSAWDLCEIDNWLNEASIPCRFSCVTDDGYPHVTSLWFLYRSGTLFFSVQENMRLLKWVNANPRCGFEIAGDRPLYRGVRGHGETSVVRAEELPVLDNLLSRYLGDQQPELSAWLKSRTDTERTMRLDIDWVTSWDYSARM